VTRGSPDATGPEESRRLIRAAGEAIVAIAGAADATLAGAELTGIGWATVDLERAERELSAALATELRTVFAARDEALGAAQRVATTAELGFALVLLEPDTEGPLAGLLARHAEGVVAAYVDVAGRTLRLDLTSDRGGPAPRAIVVRPPWAAG